MEDESLPRPAIRFTPPPLDSWGIAELTGYIETLRGEIARAEAAIRARQAQRAAADAFFKQPGGQ